MHISRKSFSLPRTGSTPELFFELCLYQGYIQNFERNWKNCICIRVNFIVIHPTHFTIYSF